MHTRYYSNKQIDLVVEDLINLGLVEVVAIMRPILTYKFRE